LIYDVIDRELIPAICNQMLYPPKTLINYDKKLADSHSRSILFSSKLCI